jgi:hypothetical protein
MDNVKNFAFGTLDIGITSGATSLTLTAGHAARFPAAPFNATLYNATDYTDAASAYHAGAAEIVRVTAVAGDVLTITRAQESTTAVAHNTGGKTYRLHAGVTAELLSRSNLIASVPKDPITTPLTLVGQTFKERGVWAPTDLIDPDFINGQIAWSSTDYSRYLRAHTLQAGSGVANGRFEFQGTSGVEWQTIKGSLLFEAPFFAITAPIFKSYSVGTCFIGLSIRSDHTSNPSKSITAVWNKEANQFFLSTRIAGVDTNHPAVSYTATAPFEMGLCVANMCVSLQIRYAGAEWQTITTHALTRGGALDLRNPTNLEAMTSLEVFLSSGGNATEKFELGNIKWGYLQGYNTVADQVLAFEDGTPIQKGSEQFIVAYSPHVSVPGNVEDIPTSNFTILAVDPLTSRIRTQAKVYTKRGGLVRGENSGCVVFDRDSGDYIYLVPNWDDLPAAAIPSAPINIYMYRRKGFPSGVIILENGVQLTLPTPLSSYDPCLRKYEGLWHLAYCHTGALVAWGSFASALATSPDLVNWTLVNSEFPSGIKYEGQKLLQVGGTRYVVATNFTEQRVYDMGLNFLGSFQLPSGISNANVSAHACLLPYRDGAHTRLFWLAFDAARKDLNDYAWGRVHILEATSRQVGHDYELRWTTDIGTGATNPASSWATSAAQSSQSAPPSSGPDYSTTLAIASSGASDLNQSILGGVFATVIAPEVVDVGNNYNPSTGIYTIPATGYYSVTTTIRLVDSAPLGLYYLVGAHTSNADGSWCKWENTGAAAVEGFAGQFNFIRPMNQVERKAFFSSGDQLRMYAYMDINSAASVSVKSAEMTVIRIA